MKEKEIVRIKKLKEIDNSFFEQNITLLAGIDEAGRGPLAGPVVVGCVILPQDSFIEGVTENKREKLYEQITSEAISWSVGIVEQDVIDEINILNATKKAVTIAIKNLQTKPQRILVDALTNIDTLEIPYTSIIKGDATSYSIAAASIIAKVTRDRIMRKLDKDYPVYGFAKHKGYGTAMHIAAIKEYGTCPLHRKSFVKSII